MLFKGLGLRDVIGVVDRFYAARSAESALARYDGSSSATRRSTERRHRRPTARRPRSSASAQRITSGAQGPGPTMRPPTCRRQGGPASPRGSDAR